MTYISVLKKEKKIIIVNNKKPYEYLSITPDALKRLYSIMFNKMALKRHFHLDDIEDKFTLKIIEQMIINE